MKDGYAICLNEWALDKDIKNELGLLLIISSLTAEKGYCYASNEYLANLFDTDENQISKKLAKLAKKGYINMSYTRRGTEIVSREIRLSKMTMDQCQNSHWTDVKNDKENNTSNNNTSNKKRKVKEKFIPPSLEEVEKYISENKLDVDAKFFYSYFEAGTWIDSKGNPVRNWKLKLLTWDKNNREKKAAASQADPLKELLKEVQNE